jgi:hypothetical protein
LTLPYPPWASCRSGRGAIRARLFSPEPAWSILRWFVVGIKKSEFPAARMADPRVELPGFGRGLSARLLALTVCFVMVSEFLIYAPSIARFRLDWLEERITAGHLAILALEATPDYMIDPELELELLEQAGALLVALRTSDGKNLVLRGGTAPPMVDATIDLSDRAFLAVIGDAFETLSRGGKRVLRVKGPSPRAPDA